MNNERSTSNFLTYAMRELSSIEVANRNKSNIESKLINIYQNGIDISLLQQKGLIQSNPNHSYGRGLITEGLPEGSESLIVNVLPHYAPAIHDHSSNTAGAHLLAISGGFYNVSYRFGNIEGEQLLTHSNIEYINIGEVGFVAGGRGGIHRVVNLSDNPVASFNFYWTKNIKKQVNKSAHIYDFGIGNGIKFTSNGSAFFFTQGQKLEHNVKASALVRLEDLVFQYYQLNFAKNKGVLPKEREITLEKLDSIIKSQEFSKIYDEASIVADKFVHNLEKEKGAIAYEYFQQILKQAKYYIQQINS